MKSVVIPDWFNIDVNAEDDDGDKNRMDGNTHRPMLFATLSFLCYQLWRNAGEPGYHWATG